MQKLLFNVAQSAGIANSPLPSWAMYAPRSAQMGPITSTQDLINRASAAEAGLGLENAVSNWSSPLTSLQPRSAMRGPERATSYRPPPPAPEAAPNDLMLDAQHIDVTDPKAITWLTRLISHRDVDVQCAAAEALSTRAVPYLTRRALAGSSSAPLILQALAEHPNREVSAPAIKVLLEEVIPKLGEFVSDGIDKRAVLERLVKCGSVQVSEHAACILKSSVAAGKERAIDDGFEWI